MSEKSTPLAPRGVLRRRLKRAGVVVPVALLSCAWTASLTHVGVSPTAASLDLPAPLPDGTSVPAEAIEAPASVSSPDDASGPGRTAYSDRTAQQIVASSSTNGIPSTALAAYQRAETVIDAADPTCHVSWQLIAAIGRVESNHGRFGGSVLGTDGIVHPAIYGIPLSIADTDGGLLDKRTGFDRAVGPMQFIPSTWQAVAVDADNDGQRNPQDINDAALGAAVYLCSGPGDLGTTAGQRSAVFRYNHSTSYVDLVLAIADAYLDGDYYSSPNNEIAGGYLSVLPQGVGHQGGHGKAKHHGGGKATAEPADQPSSTATPSPSSGPTSSSPTPSPSSPSGVPTRLPLPTNHPTVALPSTGVSPIDGVLDAATAVLNCTLDGYVDNPLSTDDPFDACVVAYETTGKPPKN